MDLNGKMFEELNANDKKCFLNYGVFCRVVLSSAEAAGVFEVYQRMNTGSENLNAQQIRRAAYR